MSIMAEILEKIEYQIPNYLQECVLSSDLIHMVQLNDLTNQRFNHVTIIGKYSEILTEQNDNIYKMNNFVKSEITSIYLEKKIDQDYLRPNHSIHNYKYNLIENKNDVLNGMLKCKSVDFTLEKNLRDSDNFYILVNTTNEKEKFNVYAYTNEKSNNVTNCDYQCLVFIGKIVNPSPYKIEDVEIFEKTNNFKLNDKFKKFLITSPKLCVLNNETGKKIFYINLFGNNPKLINKFTKTDNKYDIEEFRPQLNKIWEKQLLDEKYNSSDDEEYNIIIHKLEEMNNSFLNGFIKIGTLLDMTNKQSQIIVDTLCDLYMLINSEPENQGTLWIFELKDDESGKTNNDINYLPIQSMTKIGCVYI